VITPRRIALVIVALALLFAMQGGEYGWTHLRSLRTQAASERARIESLRVETDSLAARLAALGRDPAAQEREAREEFGMIREGEFLVRLVPARSPRGN
jgi:cell division protein FtsB